jgi:hypothetical protein
MSEQDEELKLLEGTGLPNEVETEEEDQEIQAPKKPRGRPRKPPSTEPKPNMKKVRSQKQIETFEKARASLKAKQEEKKKLQAEVNKIKKQEREEKIIKTAVNIKKKQLKEEAILNDYVDDDTPIEVLKEAIADIKRKKALARKDLPAKPEPDLTPNMPRPNLRDTKKPNGFYFL